MDSRSGWLNRTVLGAGLTSGLGDLCYETAQAVLPAFLALLGAPPAMVGSIEGLADGLNSFTKLVVGYLGDRLGARKALAVFGYALTPLGGALIALATAWPMILIGRLIGWFGKGVRGPVRDAIMAGAVGPEYRGRAFGLHRAADSLGAVLGPALAALTLSGLNWSDTAPPDPPPAGPAATAQLVRADQPPQSEATAGPATADSADSATGDATDSATNSATGNATPAAADSASSASAANSAEAEQRFRWVLWLAVIPGVLSALSFALLVEDRGLPAKRKYEFTTALRRLPKTYRRYLAAVALFAFGDFSPALLMLAVTTLMSPQTGLLVAAQWAAWFYVLRNTVQTLASLPIGFLGDRWGIRRSLLAGYFLGAAVGGGTALVFALGWNHSAVFAGLFILSGAYAAFQEALEPAAAAAMLPEAVRGVGYGSLGAVNGAGKLVSSGLVGWVWSLVSPAAAFAVAAGLMAAGSLALSWAFFSSGSAGGQDCAAGSE